MLQLRRPGPPRQRVQVTTPAQEVPFLPEHRPHGCQLPNQSTTVLTGFSGKTVPLERRRGGAQPLGTASRDLWLNEKLGNTDAGESEAYQTALMERWETRSPFTCWSCFWNYLRLKKKKLLMKFCFVLFLFGVTLRNTAVLLHSGRFLNVWITAVLLGVWDCGEQCHITGYLDEFL